jgi:hypothetical protein
LLSKEREDRRRERWGGVCRKGVQKEEGRLSQENGDLE